MKKTKAIVLGFAVGILLVAIPLTVYLAKQQQETRSRADEPTCELPGTVTNVHIAYPNCEGDQCSFEQASCSWDAVVNAAGLSLKITEVDTNREVRSESVTPQTTKVVFSVTQGKTYKCDVTAVNSCGQVGGTGTDTKLCQVEGILPTPSPTQIPPTPTSTPAPTQIVLPTSTPAPIIITPTPLPTVVIVTPTPQPTLAQPGDSKTVAILGAGSVAVSLIGIILFILIGL